MISNKMLLWMPRVLATPRQEEYGHSREGVHQLPLSQTVLRHLLIERASTFGANW